MGSATSLIWRRSVLWASRSGLLEDMAHLRSWRRLWRLEQQVFRQGPPLRSAKSRD
jgi:hypothetical protein